MDVSLKQKKEIVINTPKSTKEQLDELTLKMNSISQMFFMLRRTNAKKKNEARQTTETLINKDGIPVNTCYMGYIRGSNCPFILTVNEKGKYFIGSDEFTSLSSAAEHVSGVRRSGWSFWKSFKGKTLKELYR